MTVTQHQEAVIADQRAIDDEVDRNNNYPVAWSFVRGRHYSEEDALKVVGFGIGGSVYQLDARFSPVPMDVYRRNIRQQATKLLAELLRAGALRRTPEGNIERTPPRGTVVECYDADGKLHIVPQRDVPAFHAANNTKRKLNQMNAARRLVGMEPLTELPA